MYLSFYPDRCTGFMRACEKGHAEVIKVLMDNKDIIDHNVKDCHGSSGFVKACANGHGEVVLLLLNHDKIDFNSANKHGQTAFIKVCELGLDQIASLLVMDEKIDIHAQNNKKETGIVLACLKGYDNVIKVILESGRLNFRDIGKNIKKKHTNKFNNLFEFKVYHDRGYPVKTIVIVEKPEGNKVVEIFG